MRAYGWSPAKHGRSHGALTRRVVNGFLEGVPPGSRNHRVIIVRLLDCYEYTMRCTVYWCKQYKDPTKTFEFLDSQNPLHLNYALLAWMSLRVLLWRLTCHLVFVGVPRPLEGAISKASAHPKFLCTVHCKEEKKTHGWIGEKWHM